MNTIGSALFNRPKSDSRSTLISLSRSSETQGPQCSRNVCQTKVIVSDRRKQNYSSGKPISSTSVQQFKYSSRTKCLQYYAYGATRYDGYVWFQGLPPAPPNIHPWLYQHPLATHVWVYMQGSHKEQSISILAAESIYKRFALIYQKKHLKQYQELENF